MWFIVIPFVIGICKEFYDKYKKKTKFDVVDMLVTWLGAVPVAIVMVLHQIIK